MKRGQFFLVALACFALWLGWLTFVPWVFDKPLWRVGFSSAFSHPGEFGDMFGGLSALFSSIALAGVLLSLLLQHKSVQEAASAANASRDALAKQIELQRSALKADAKIAALCALAEHERDLIATYRRWEQEAKSDDTRERWRAKKNESLESYRSLICELRKLGEINFSTSDLGESPN